MLTGGGIALCAQLVSRAAPAPPEIQNIAVAKLIQIFHTDLGTPVVIYRYIALRHLTQVLPDEHGGDATEIGMELVVALDPGGEKEDTVYLTANHELKELPLLLRIPGRVAKDNVVASGAGLPVDMIGKLRHEGGVHTGEDQTKELGGPHHHGPGHGVGRVVHILAQLQDPTSGFFADLGAACQRAGDGGVGDAGGFGHVLDGDVFHTLLLCNENFRTIHENIVTHPHKKSKQIFV